jgi:ketosteroid isomerase-like protein
MARVRAILLVLVCGWLTSCSLPTTPHTTMSARDQVFAAERAFAATMARRDLAAFGTFVDEEAIFFTGPEPLRGKAQVIAGWSRYFKEPQAPSSWEPDEVEVLASGTLAHSSGPVRAPDGKVVARFNSIWRLHPSGGWKVVFDKGSPLPSPPSPSAPPSAPPPASAPQTKP